MIYHKVIRPFVLKHEKQIDSLLDRGAHAARQGIDEGRKLAEEASVEAAKKHFE